MKRASFSVLFFIKKTKLLKNGEAPIRLRITVNSISVELQIRRSVALNLWSEAKECSMGRTKAAAELNEYIRMLKLRVLTIQRELEAEGTIYTARLIMDKLYSCEEGRYTLLNVFRKHNNDCRRLIGIDYVQITVSRFDNCCKYLGHFIQKQYGKEDMNLTELNGEFVRNFEIYLKTTRNCQQNTVIRYMKGLKKIVNLAIANDWMHKNPFAGIRFQEKEVIREVLTKEEIERMMCKEFALPRLEYVRDVFIFCVFTGMAYVDVNNLRQEHIVRDNNDDLWIRKARQKTNNMCNIPLLKIPQLLMEKYKNHPLCTKTGALLPVPSNQKMNSYLKEIADFCGIQKNLTTHAAKHHTISI